MSYIAHLSLPGQKRSCFIPESRLRQLRCDVIVCYGNARLVDKHLSPTVHCVDGRLFVDLSKVDQATITERAILGSVAKSLRPCLQLAIRALCSNRQQQSLPNIAPAHRARLHGWSVGKATVKQPSCGGPRRTVAFVDGEDRYEARRDRGIPDDEFSGPNHLRFPVAMVRDARRRAPHHEGHLILRSGRLAASRRMKPLNWKLF